MSLLKKTSLLWLPSRALCFVRQCEVSGASLVSMLLLAMGKAASDTLSAVLLAGALTLLLPVGRPAASWYAAVEAFASDQLNGSVSPMLLLVVGLILCKGIFTPILLGLRGRLIDRWTLLVSLHVLEMQLTLGREQRRNAHAQGSNVAVNYLVPRIVMGAIVPSLDLLTETALICALLTILMMLEPLPTAMLIAALLVALGLGGWLARKVTDGHSDQRARQQTLMQRWVAESIACLREIHLYRRVPAVLKRYRPVAELFSKESARERALMDIQSPVLELLFLLVLGGAVSIASRSTVQADMQVLALFSAMGLRLIVGLRRITTIAQTLKFSSPTLAELTATGSLVAEGPTIELLESDCASPALLICKSVYYSYPGANRDVIRGLNLTLQKGQWIGLMGESGVGKSTLVDLLIGELQPCQGSILWLGDRGIGYAGAVTTLIPGTLRDNVAFLGVQDGDQQLLEVLGIVGVDSLLQRLPQKLDTPVEVFEQSISSGERQRIGLARALLHARSLLILDEATASLDQLTESRFLQQLRASRPELTVLLITHRLSALSYTEEKLLMVNGALDIFTPEPQTVQVTAVVGHRDTCI